MAGERATLNRKALHIDSSYELEEVVREGSREKCGMPKTHYKRMKGNELESEREE